MTQKEIRRKSKRTWKNIKKLKKTLEAERNKFNALQRLCAHPKGRHYAPSLLRDLPGGLFICPDCGLEVSEAEIF